MLNDKLLRSYITLQGYYNKDCAKRLGISECSFYKKLTGKTEFKASEIQKLAQFLEIPDTHIMEIFFAEDVDRKETRKWKIG